MASESPLVLVNGVASEIPASDTLLVPNLTVSSSGFLACTDLQVVNMQNPGGGPITFGSDMITHGDVHSNTVTTGSITASSDIAGSGNLSIAGSTTLANMDVTGNTTLSNVSVSNGTFSGAVITNAITAPSGVLTITGNTTSAGNLNFSGSGVFGGDVAVGGNCSIDASHGTTSSPAVLGLQNLGAARFQFGDALNCIQTAFGDRQQWIGYWGLEIHGNAQGTAIAFAGGGGSDPALNVVGSLTSPPVIVASGPSGLTGDLFQGIVNGSVVYNIDHTGSANVKHVNGKGTAPAITAGAGAGTSPTLSLTGNDVGGLISLTTGTLPSTSATLFTVTFNVAFAAAPYVSFSPANSAAAALGTVSAVYVTSTSTTFVITSGTTALAASTAYAWSYHVSG
jgi:hypothetical protein